jgi:8-oxo-dGTP diphosphatase
MRQIMRSAACGLAVRPDGTFLLTQRNSPQTPIWHLKWNIPGGGIEWGETPEETLRREFSEEIGVVPKVLYTRPLPVTALWYSKNTGYHTDAHILLLTYLVDIGEQEIDLTNDPEQETAAYKWFTLPELTDFDTLPQTKETVKTLLKLYQQK